MQELLDMAIKLHTIFIGCMLVIGVVNLFIILSDAKNFSKKIKFLNPIYYMFFAAIGFTGVIILGVMHLKISHASALMIGVFLVIFIMSIKLYKVYKKASLQQYRTYAKRKYLLDLGLMLLTISLVYMV
ncbi:MAG: hypothetical protein PWQ42_155 [Sulfurospirillum sp.]|jgi:hypothetical protein|nr:hypothetical protein [Sulfurospirillum sp.]